MSSGQVYKAAGQLHAIVGQVHAPVGRVGWFSYGGAARVVLALVLVAVAAGMAGAGLRLAVHGWALPIACRALNICTSQVLSSITRTAVRTISTSLDRCSRRVLQRAAASAYTSSGRSAPAASSSAIIPDQYSTRRT